ncbi:DUF4376 domain-containing protein, partial [Avibacterium avium]|uniref:DUF4376 domain-containing protein n=1 Tax=Avibacterium avium TaxID=751 RepID=UPI003BF82141
MIFYDPKINVFYDSNIHSNIPHNAIQITSEQHQRILNALNTGCVIKDDLTFSPPRPTTYHKWDGTEWVLDESKQAELLTQQRAQIRTQINTKRDTCVNGGVYVPEIEKWVDTDEKGRATLVEIKADFDLNG